MPTISIRWADNTAELKKNLAAGLDQIEATKAGVDKLAASLRGDNLIAAANKYAAAVREIGGAANLTASQQERVNSIMTRAVESMNAAGKGGTDLAKHFQELADATKQLPEGLGAGVGSAKELQDALLLAFDHPIYAVRDLSKAVSVDLVSALGAGTIAAGVAGAAIAGAFLAAGKELYDLTKEATQTGTEIYDASLKMSASVPKVSELKFAVEAAGGSLEQLSNAAFMMQQRMETNPQQFEKGLAEIGLSLKDIEALSPDERFLAIARALRESGDATNKQAAAMELFGRQGRDLLPLLLKPLDELIDDSKRLGMVWTNEDAKAADELAIKTRELGLQWDALKTKLGADLIPALRLLVDHGADVANTFVKGTDQGVFFDAVLHGIKLQAEGASAAIDVLAHREATLPGLPSAPTPNVAAGLPAGFTLGSAEEKRAIEETNAALKKQEEARKAAQKAIEEYQAALTRVLEAERGYAGVLDDLDASTVAAIRYDLQHGAALEDLVKVYKVTSQQVKAVSEDLKFQESVLEATHKVFKDFVAIVPDLSGRTQELENQLAGLTANGLLPADDTVSKFNKHLLELKEIGPGVRTGLSTVHDELKDWSKDLGELSRAFSQLATIAGGSFGGIVKDVGEVVASLNTAVKGMDALDNATTALGKLAGGVSALTGFVSVFEIAGTFAESLTTPLWVKAMQQVRHDFGFAISQGVADGIAKSQLHLAIEALAKAGQSPNFGRAFGTAAQFAQPAELLNLPQIISEHPINASNLEMYEGKVHDLFSAIEKGQISVADATNVLDQVFPQLLAAGTDAYGRITPQLKELIRLNAQFGTQSKEIAAFLKEQAGNALSGLADTLAGTTLGNASDLQAASTEALGTYEAAIAAGVSETDALKAIQPALDQIRQAYKDLGIDIEDAALKALLIKSNVAESAPAVVNAIAGIVKQMVSLDNIGAETSDMFHAQQVTASSLYTKIQASVAAAGGTTKDALGEMQTYLHEAAQEAANLGIPLDENTQILIDQSKELGIWKEAGKSAAQQQKESTDALTAAIDHLTKALLGIPNVDFTVTQHNRQVLDDTVGNAASLSASILAGQNGEAPEAQPGAGGATGGLVADLVRGFQPRSFAAGGPVGYSMPILPPVNPSDTQLIWTNPNEWIFDRPRQSVILSQLQAGASMAEFVRDTVREITAAPSAPQPSLANVTPRGGDVYLDSRKVGQVIWSPEALSGETRQLARLQVKQLGKEGA